MAIPLIAAGIAAGGGALLGGLSSAFGASDKNARLKAAGKSIDQLKAQQAAGYENIKGDLAKAYTPYTKNAGADYESYRQAAQQLGANLRQYAEAGSFDFDLDQAINNLMDPLLESKQEAAAKVLEGSAASAGKLNSSATLSSLAKRSGELYDTAWKDALGAAQRQQAQEYGQWSDAIARDRAAVDQYNANLQSQLAAMGNLAGMGQGATLGLANTSAGLSSASLSDQGNLALQKIAMQAQQGSPAAAGLSGALTGATGVLNSLFK